ncbi:hypothetical protein ACFQHO_07135 [Actinomadura yumaensis]|uniref:hypothetical protein n=1 Tax=Actinomadura yumaensis TaxID=111807 RepID=UPI00361B1136
MPLDPRAEKIAAAMAAGFPPLGPDTDAADVRRALESNPIPDIEPLPVGRVEDRTIPGPGGPLPIRLYWPQTPPPTERPHARLAQPPTRRRNDCKAPPPTA